MRLLEIDIESFSLSSLGMSRLEMPGYTPTSGNAEARCYSTKLVCK